MEFLHFTVNRKAGWCLAIFPSSELDYGAGWCFNCGVQDWQWIQGRCVSAQQIQWLEAWIAEHPHWSRKRLARELCVQWHWRDERGRLKDFAARSLLLKLHLRGRIGLPPLRTQFRSQRRPPTQPSNWQEPPPWQGSLDPLLPLRIKPVDPGSSDAQ